MCITAYAKGTPVNNTDAIRLSLATCAPERDLFSYFGHTAIRYEEPSKGIDWVFNYGIFTSVHPTLFFALRWDRLTHSRRTSRATGSPPNTSSMDVAYGNKTLNLDPEENKTPYATDRKQPVEKPDILA